MPPEEYQPPSSDNFEMESQFILRLPHLPAASLKAAVKSGKLCFQCIVLLLVRFFISILIFTVYMIFLHRRPKSERPPQHSAGAGHSQREGPL